MEISQENQVNQQLVANEEMKIEEPAQENQNQEQQQEQMQSEEEKENEPNANIDSGFSFGYDNEVLRANGYDPAILAELPEDMRAELLSSIDPNILGPRPGTPPPVNLNEE